MGFCLFSNAAIAIRHLQATGQVSRVAVVDWDVHHGNGTQAVFYDDPSVLTISLHQENLFPPSSGSLAENGVDAGEGYNVNVPLPPGSGIGAYRAAFERVVLPALDRFRPDMIVVASGFDASGVDPLGRMMLSSAAYREMTRMLLAAARSLCGGRILMTHEGGYSEMYAPYCGLAVLEELSGVKTDIADPWEPLMAAWGRQRAAAASGRSDRCGRKARDPLPGGGVSWRCGSRIEFGGCYGTVPAANVAMHRLL